VNKSLDEFASAVQRPEQNIDLETAAFWLGGIAADGTLDLLAYRASLDGFAQLARAKLALEHVEPDNPLAKIDALANTLFGELGFRGNSEDYYDPRNSFLHRVIARRVGIPISLSVLYLAVARRLGIPARGVGFPGHFLVRVEGPASPLFIDAFAAGNQLDSAGLQALLVRRSGAEAKLSPAMLEPISSQAILTRMLFNLSGIYGQRNDWTRSLAVLERLSLLDPENPRIARELIELRARVRTLN
jgi:regulator of sirC expression with transglutaminase-like and TPR domain